MQISIQESHTLLHTTDMECARKENNRMFSSMFHGHLDSMGIRTRSLKEVTIELRMKTFPQDHTVHTARTARSLSASSLNSRFSSQDSLSCREPSSNPFPESDDTLGILRLMI